MECICGFTCGTVDAFLRHAEAERQRAGERGQHHELADGGGLPKRPPPKKGSVAANVAKRKDRARFLIVPFSCEACAFSCGTTTAWMRHQERCHAAECPTTRVSENDSSRENDLPARASPVPSSSSMPTFEYEGSRQSEMGAKTIDVPVDVPAVIGPVAARCVVHSSVNDTTQQHSAMRICDCWRHGIPCENCARVP